MYSKVPIVRDPATGNQIAQIDQNTYAEAGADGKWNVKEGTAPASSGAGGGGPLEFVGSVFAGKALGGGLIGGLVGALAWAGTAAVVTKLAASLFGASDRLSSALTSSIAAGVFAWKGIDFMAQNKVFESAFLAKNSFLIGLGVGIAIFLLTYKKEKKRLVSFQCLPFEPPLGGAQCEAC